MVFQFDVREAAELEVDAAKADGVKCERCWHYDVDTNKDPKFPAFAPNALRPLSEIRPQILSTRDDRRFCGGS